MERARIEDSLALIWSVAYQGPHHSQRFPKSLGWQLINIDTGNFQTCACSGNHIGVK
jgi:hypothetical protein